MTAVRGLPEEVIATLFAQYSRSKAPCGRAPASPRRRGRDRAPGPDQSADALTERARAFHEKWTRGTGTAAMTAPRRPSRTRDGSRGPPSLDARSSPLRGLNPETHEVEYLDAVRLIVAPHTGPMYRVDAYPWTSPDPEPQAMGLPHHDARGAPQGDRSSS